MCRVKPHNGSVHFGMSVKNANVRVRLNVPHDTNLMCHRFKACCACIYVYAF